MSSNINNNDNPASTVSQTLAEFLEISALPLSLQKCVDFVAAPEAGILVDDIITKHNIQT